MYKLNKPVVKRKKKNLWSLGQKGFLSDFEKMIYMLNYRPKCPEVADFCYFGIITIRHPYCGSLATRYKLAPVFIIHDIWYVDTFQTRSKSHLSSLRMNLPFWFILNFFRVWKHAICFLLGKSLDRWTIVYFIWPCPGHLTLTVGWSIFTPFSALLSKITVGLQEV